MPTFRVLALIVLLMLAWVAVRADPGTFTHFVQHLVDAYG